MTAATPTDGQFSGVINFTPTKSIDQARPTWTFAYFTGPSAFLAASEVNTDRLAFGFAAGTEIKILQKKRPTFARLPVAGKAEGALRRALTNDLGTQPNAIRNNQR